MEIEQLKLKFAHPGNEAAALACVLRDPANYFEVESKLDDNDFLSSHHRAIWTVLKTLIREGVTALDISAILNQANALKLEEYIGGYDYISALFDKSVDPANIDFYIQRILDASTKCKVVHATQEIKNITEKNKTLTGETLTADAIVDYSQQKFLQISIENEKGTDASNLSEGLQDLIEEVKTTPVKGLDTGFPILDTAINGLEPGTLTVLGARPKIGKSGYLANVAKHVAFNLGVPVLYLDTEMQTKEQQFRLLSILSGVPERSIKNGSFYTNESDVSAVNGAVEIAKSGLILHKYYSDFTPEGVAALARKYQHQHGIGLLIFDYIKLPDADLQLLGNVKEHQALGFLCVALKNLAGQLNIPVLTAAQIGRGGANKSHVTAADFADSDRILRYANTLLGLSMKTQEDMRKLEEEYSKDTARQMGTHRIQILETRAGGTNFSGIDIYFRKNIIKMSEARVQLADFVSEDREDA